MSRPPAAPNPEVPYGAAATTVPSPSHAVLSMAIHELRVPLQAITAGVEFLESGCQGQFADVFARLHRSIDAIAGRLRNVADFARLVESPLPRSTDNVDLLDFFSRLIDEHRADADARSQRLSGVLPFELGSTVRVDAIRLHQILENYLLNAIQHSAPGGAITVAARVVDHPGSGERKLEVTVSDQGPGISPSVSEMLWEPLSTTKPPTAGGGLGLTIVKLLAETAGWQVGHAAIDRSGVAFYVRLPVDEPSC